MQKRRFKSSDPRRAPRRGAWLKAGIEVYDYMMSTYGWQTLQTIRKGMGRKDRKYKNDSVDKQIHRTLLVLEALGKVTCEQDYVDNKKGIHPTNFWRRVR